MAKTKNKKRASSDRIHIKKEPKKLNPFEVHINKEKLRVIGKKQKNDKGLPGISRAKAIQKRKSTLLEEFKVQNKSNSFLDKRIGEKVNMDQEEKAMARFTALKVKSHTKKSIFNLADDEILTHKGQTLSEIEKFDDPRSDADDDDFSDEDKSGNLTTNFVKEAHFGGGIFSNTGKEGAMTHKDLINQLIFESKKRKAEKQKAKEATLELTEKLDSDWKDLIPLVTNDPKKKDEETKNTKIDDYDKVMRELKFEKRGTVSDRLKTEEEIAKEEKESLEKLEQERIKRMNKDFDDNKIKPKHRSADDLDDNFVYEDDDNDEYMLSYNQEGKSNLQIEANMNGTLIKINDDSSQNNDVIKDESNDVEDQETSEEDLDSESEDNLSDLKEDESDSDENEDNENVSIETEKDTNSVTAESKKDPELKVNNNKMSDKNSNVVNLESTETLEETNIPFTFQLPETYELLVQTLESYENNQHVVIERMVKCNHPSLSDQNKDKLGLLFAYLLQYLNDLFCEDLTIHQIKEHFEIFQKLAPQIYALAQLNNENAHNCLLEVIKEKFGEYKKKPKRYPGLEVLIFFKLVSVLFPTSDYRHQVVSPCYVFMEQILTKCKIQNRKDICYGLFISTLILEYTTLSKRYLPSVINYLSGLLHMAIPKTGVKLVKVFPPFKATSSLLVLISNYSLESLNTLKLESADFCKEEISPEFQIRVLHNAIRMLEQFLDHYKVLSSHVEIFERTLNYLLMIPITNYPKEVRNGLNNLTELFKKSKDERQLEYLVLETAKPKALRLYEPKIQVVYDGKQHKVQSKEKAQINKLLHKVKREKKGALREIRRDTAFLGRVKIHKQLQSDKERREKVKRIYSEAANQQHEFNQIDRKKKRKH